MDSVKELEDNLLSKLKENPYDSNILNKLGYIYLHSDNRVKSEEYYLKSIAVDKKQFEPFVSLSLISTINGRLEKALYYLYKAKENSHDSLELNKSIEEIVFAIVTKEGKISQTQSEILQRQAYELAENYNLEESIELYIKLSCLFPDNENVLINSASAFIKNGDFLIAHDILSLVISKSENPLAYHYLGITLNFLGQKDLALEYFKKAITLKPSLADILLNGKYALYKKEYDEKYINKCPSCESDKNQKINVLNQSQNSLNFNCINPIRVWEKCGNCNLVFTNPMPSHESINEYNFNLFNYISQLKSVDIEKIIVENNVANERLKKIEKLTTLYKGLDINSYDMSFMTVAKRREWDIKGIDNNLSRVNENKEIFGLDIIPMDFNSYKTNEKYGCITLWESIEKIKDFKQFIKKVYDLLDDKGVFALSFHDINSYISKKLGYDYPIWSYPDYLYFFSIDTLAKILIKQGFEIVDIDCVERKFMGNTDIFCIKSQTLDVVTV